MPPSRRVDTRHPTPEPSHTQDLVERLGDEQLLQLVIGRPRDVACRRKVGRLLEMTASLEALARLSPEVLEDQAGLRRDLVLRLHAAFELGRRRWAGTSDEGIRLDTLVSVVEWARPRLLPLDHEEVWLLCLDGRNTLRSSRRIAQGGLHSCALAARDILRPALRDGASAIILVHNHPSGDPTPSVADVEMTSEVDVACAAVGILMLDHVVVASGGAASLLELGVVHAQ